MITQTEKVELEQQLEYMFEFIKEDWSTALLSQVVAELMIWAREETNLDLCDCAYNIALDWSK